MIQIDVLNKHLFITSKPVIYLVNMAEADFIRKKNKWYVIYFVTYWTNGWAVTRLYFRRLPKLKEWIDTKDAGAIMLPFSGAYEAKLADMEADARKAFCEENKAHSTFDKIIAQGYKSLNLMYFFTAGPNEVKAWTIQVSTNRLIDISNFNEEFFFLHLLQKGTKAPQAGGRIHSDFEKGFIMAEVFKVADLKEEGSEAAVKVI